jgi:hypothetical protein
VKSLYGHCLWNLEECETVVLARDNCHRHRQALFGEGTHKATQPCPPQRLRPAVDSLDASRTGCKAWKRRVPALRTSRSRSANVSFSGGHAVRHTRGDCFSSILAPQHRRKEMDFRGPGVRSSRSWSARSSTADFFEPSRSRPLPEKARTGSLAAIPAREPSRSRTGSFSQFRQGRVIRPGAVRFLDWFS